MNNLPSFQPTTVPSGEYVAQIKTDCVEKTSQFDQTKTYRELGMVLRNQRGEFFEFTWSFSPKTPIYKNVLIILSGKEQVSGIVDPPEKSIIGEKFIATITERTARNDKTRLVNEIIRAMPYVKPKKEEEVEAEEFEEEPDARKGEVPF